MAKAYGFRFVLPIFVRFFFSFCEAKDKIRERRIESAAKTNSDNRIKSLINFVFIFHFNSSSRRSQQRTSGERNRKRKRAKKLSLSAKKGSHRFCEDDGEKQQQNTIKAIRKGCGISQKTSIIIRSACSRARSVTDATLQQLRRFNSLGLVHA